MGSIHPCGPALIVALAVFGWFAAALGVWISIQLRSTWRAQFLTISSLLLVNIAGQGIANTLSRRGFAPMVWPGFTPYEISKLVFDRDFLDDWRTHSGRTSGGSGHRQRPGLVGDL